MIKIALPLPNPKLSPNRKNGRHWSTTKKDKIKSKTDAYFATKQALNEYPLYFDHNSKLQQTVNIVFADKRRRDIDNFIACCKAYFDGIYLALGIDDSQVIRAIVNKLPPDKKESGMVVEICVLT